MIQLLDRFKNYFPLSIAQKQSLKHFFDVEYTYNTNAIEWTTLTEKQTIKVLNGLTVPQHSLVEHLEVMNHKKAFNYIFDITKWFTDVHDKIGLWKKIFHKENILKIHKFVLNSISDENAWIYRNLNVRIAYSRAVLPRHEKVSDLMDKFILTFVKRSWKIDVTSRREILDYWYDLHLQLVAIHPFLDWNWRLARLLMSMWFLVSLNTINVIYYKNRSRYIDVIETALINKDMNKYHNFMNSNFKQSLKNSLEILDKNIFYKY